MKKILLGLAIGMLLLTACNDWLDVDASTDLDRNELFKTEAGFSEALTGVYATMCSENLYGRTTTFDVLDILAGYYNFAWGTNATWVKYDYSDPSNQYAKTYCDPFFENIWNGTYSAIANLNSMLESMEANRGVFSGDNYSIMRGEALGLRAFLHFDLLRMFAPAYPLGNDKEAIPYVSVLSHGVTPLFKQEDVVKMILSDLKEAKTLLENDPMHLGITPSPCLASLPNGNNVKNHKIQPWHNRRFHFNYYAVLATMARVYLWQGDKVNALACAKEVIADQEKRFPWVDKNNLSNIGSSTSDNQDRSFATEQIFALNIRKMEDNMDSYCWIGKKNLNTQLLLQASLNQRSEVYENNSADIRYQYWFQGYNSNFLLSKFYQNNKVARYFQERLPLIRISEMYYIAAECADNTADGVDYLEKVRVNRGLNAFALDRTMTADALKDEIRKEYRKELWGEGQLWFYYKRNSFTGFTPYMKNTDAFTFAIPDAESSLR